jgi:GNAT superfamily N-acetyltransferase
MIHASGGYPTKGGLVEKPQLIRSIEEILITDWPSFEQVLMDGWVLRFAAGYTFRSNSVQTIYSGSEDVAEKIRHCESLYSDRGLPTTFKILPIMQPPDLDMILQSRGYRVHTPTSVQVLDALPKRSVCIDDEDTRCASLSEWLDAFSIISGLPAEKKPFHAGIVERIPFPICTLLIVCDGRPTACGLGVLHGDCLDIYDICTAPSMRRMGLGTRIMQGLLGWASEAGATRACLGVVEANAPAVGMYGKLGFRHLYSYWYRIRDEFA